MSCAVREALKEARPYVYNRTTGDETWREQTARDVLTRVDEALAAPCRCFTEEQIQRIRVGLNVGHGMHAGIREPGCAACEALALLASRDSDV